MTKTASKSRLNGTLASASTVAPPAMQPAIVVFRIVGMSPLLQNNPAAFIGASSPGGLGQKPEYIDEDEARKRCYLDEDGRFVHPADAFRKAMIKAVAKLNFGKGKSAPAIIKGCVFCAEQFCVIEDGKGKPATKYEIDRRSVVNPSNKARVLRCRPVWSPWAMRLALELDMAFVEASHIRDALLLAGRKIGVGDYRPEKGGSFGRFTVE